MQNKAAKIESQRDHRLLGEQLDLFHFEEEAPGLPFFHPKGSLIFQALLDLMRHAMKGQGYSEVRTPLILPESAWHQSGHYENYRENMFFARPHGEQRRNPHPMVLKPMNCPGHVMLYRKRKRSHRELPIRLAEMGQVHRHEPSGVRHGLMRVQSFVQDDAHIFCTPEQVQSEIEQLLNFFFEVYRLFELDNIRVELSTRPAQSIGSDSMWESAEDSLSKALSKCGIAYEINKGDGAFYGPKIDFHIRDSLGRSWQCGTIQLDFSMPQRFDLKYIDDQDQSQVPVMIHRACYGSVERFFGILLEHFAGALPVWLSPEQVRILPVSSKYNSRSEELVDFFQSAGLRCESDNSDNRLAHKIRCASREKIPILLILGEKEIRSNRISVRTRDGKNLGEFELPTLLAELQPWTIPQLLSQKATSQNEL